jgi:acyl carrier protein
MEDFKEKFNTLLIDKLNINGDALKPDTNFFDLGANSLDMVELIIEFEKAFGITIPDDDAEKITTIGEAEKYLKTKMKISK